jgi:hypothetical protein
MGASRLGKSTKFVVYNGYIIPQAPTRNIGNGYANFVKENFSKIKEQNKDLKLI